MCAIVGAFSFEDNKFKVTEEYLVKMRDTMIHRGPDGSGLWVSKDQKIGMGHRRLAIIDLSHKATQPMSNQDGSIQIVFNGEIYNHAEIRSTLCKTGKYQWKTDHSDTEVIIHSYEEWGLDCVNHFRGMFAIALWDTNEQSLWLIRDRIGIKPLYYSIHHGRIVFASEIKALIEDPEQEKEVNEDGLFDFLSFLTVPAPDTMFKGIKKLPAGTWLKISKTGKLCFNKYWDVLENTKQLGNISEQELCSLLIDELSTAVKYRKVSDVQVGVFLSGGIDSSTNTALFSQDSKAAIKTFSIGYEGRYRSYQNELKYAQLVAEKYRATFHSKLLIINDLVDFLPRMIELQDEPIADPVCVPLYYVSKLARENRVVVCQVGEGADELFFGYPGWARNLKIQKLNGLPIPHFMKVLISNIFKFFGKDKHGYYEYLRRASNKQPIFWGGSEGYTHNQKLNLLSSRMKKKYKERNSFEAIKPIWDQFQQKSIHKSPIDWMTYMDLNLRLPELLLMRVDKMSMGVSLEARVPFLDHKFVEFAMSIPSEYKFKDNTLKYILKKAVRGIIPDQIIDRKKQGFGAPIQEWFEGALGVKARESLKDFCLCTDYLDWNQVEKQLNSNKKSETWPILNLALWWDKYIKR